jgi:hypothetical protein
MKYTPSGCIPACDCRGRRGGPPALVADTEHVAPREVIDSPVKKKEVEASKDILAQACTPGHFWCDQTGFDWIIVCNAQGIWEKSSYCGKTDQGYGW